MTDVRERTAFITGGGNGIGLGIARSLARAGAKLVLTDVDEAGLERAKAELQSLTPVETFRLDVRDREAYAATVEAAERVQGPVSLLFNNAGVAGGGAAAQMTYELWDWGLGINLHGVINGVQTFLPRMVERGEGGHIVNTASGAGLAATGAGALYTTAKFGVVGLSEALHGELAPAKIGVSVLCPGPVATDIVRRTAQTAPRSGRTRTPEEAAAAAERLDRSARWLHRDGVSIDAVGEMVLGAVRDGRLYIHTDRQVEPLIKARAQALLDALPN